MHYPLSGRRASKCLPHDKAVSWGAKSAHSDPRTADRQRPSKQTGTPVVGGAGNQQPPGTIHHRCCISRQPSHVQQPNHNSTLDPSTNHSGLSPAANITPPPSPPLHRTPQLKHLFPCPTQPTPQLQHPAPPHHSPANPLDIPSPIPAHHYNITNPPAPSVATRGVTTRASYAPPHTGNAIPPCATPLTASQRRWRTPLICLSLLVLLKPRTAVCPADPSPVFHVVTLPLCPPTPFRCPQWR